MLIFIAVSDIVAVWRGRCTSQHCTCTCYAHVGTVAVDNRDIAAVKMQMVGQLQLLIGTNVAAVHRKLHFREGQLVIERNMQVAN